ncbi:MAG: putative glucose-1-phosphate cytidylyltransferase [Chitinophagales bacterium]|nr:MAG: putative glucose-1-phosphate cytidylyltransferase [Chitinophagales bacterium]
MKTIILCGGKSERLKNQQTDLPKPLWKIGDKPILWHVMKIYEKAGFTDFVLCTGYRHEDFAAYFDNHPVPGWQITFDHTSENLGTAERILSAMKYVDADFFCTYADGLSSLSVSDLLKNHQQAGKIATLTAVKPIIPYGILEMDAHNIVTQFKEKSRSDHWINGGFFVFKPAVADYLRLGSMLENEPLSTLAADRQLYAYLHEGAWQCMDTYKDFVTLNNLWLQGGSFWI